MKVHRYLFLQNPSLKTPIRSVLDLHISAHLFDIRILHRTSHVSRLMTLSLNFWKFMEDFLHYLLSIIIWRSEELKLHFVFPYRPPPLLEFGSGHV